MRIPTVTQFHDQSEIMSEQMEHIHRLQQKAETGTKIQRSSEDPALASQIIAVKDYIQQLSDYDTNGKLAQNRNALFSTALKNGVGIMDKVRELTQAAQNDTLNNNDRNNIANELQSYQNQLLQVANTQDGNGSYIFSGFNSNTPAFSQQGTQFQYQGGYECSSIYISPTVAAPYNQSGYNIFGDISLGNGTFTVAAGTTNAGTAISSPGSVVNNANYVADTYTLSFVNNSAGQLAYQIVGASSGQVLPAPPATTPADAPAYVASSAIDFNGMSINISGQPAVGDTFQIAPSKTQDMFTTLQQMITTLRTPINDPSQQAAFHQNMMQSSASLYQVSQQLITVSSDMGSSGAAIDTQVKTNDETITSQKMILGQLADADMAEVTSTLMQQNMELEATQQIYIKIQETLFQLMKDSSL